MRPTRMIPDFAQLVRTRMSVDAVEGLGTSSGRAGSADLRWASIELACYVGRSCPEFVG